MRCVYLAVFLEPEYALHLKAWFAHAVMPLHATHYSHHMTVMFKPTPEQINAFPLKVNCTLKVTGFGADEFGQAVIVKPTCALGLEISAPTPHITVACAEGTKPFYSNELISRAHMSVINGPTLGGWTGWWDGTNFRYDKWQGADVTQLKGRI